MPGITIRDAGTPRPADRPGAGTPRRSPRARCCGAPGGRRRSGSRSRVHKGLPLSGGQGGSAASAVAGAVAVNASARRRRSTRDALLAACLEAEAAVAGRHPDNVAPSLLGGIVLVRSMDPPDVVPLPVPADLRSCWSIPTSGCAHRGRAGGAAAGRAARDRAAPGGAGRGAWWPRSPAATTPCSAARSTTGSPSRPGRRSCPGFAEAKAAALAAGALGARSPAAGPRRSRWPRGEASGGAIGAAMAGGVCRRGASRRDGAGGGRGSAGRAGDRVAGGSA